MRTWAWLLLLAAAGVAAGAAVVFTVQDHAAGPPPRTTTSSTTTTTVVDVTPRPTAPAAPPDEGLYLVWTRGGLAPGLGEALATDPSVAASTIVRRGPVDLVRSTDCEGVPVDEPAPGFVIPIDAVAFDPTTYPAVMPAAHQADLAGLGDEEVLLGATSARVRRLGPGATLTFARGTTFTVAGVVDDEVVGGAEVALTTGGAQRFGATAPAYVLFTSTAERATLEATVRSIVGPDRAVRLRAVGETPFLRNGDAVLPQVAIKEQFGEFSYRRVTGSRDGDAIEPDPAWVEANIVRETVPVLGEVRCHRSILPALRGALGDIERENLGHLLPPEGYLGCFVPRTTRYDEQISRHSWGVALDLNYPTNPTGQRSVQDERLIEIFQAWGFTWGGEWLVPDPAHVEILRPAAP